MGTPKKKPLRERLLGGRLYPLPRSLVSGAVKFSGEVTDGCLKPETARYSRVHTAPGKTWKVT